jgi:hypothetical protein
LFSSAIRLAFSPARRPLFQTAKFRQYVLDQQIPSYLSAAP